MMRCMLRPRPMLIVTVLATTLGALAPVTSLATVGGFLLLAYFPGRFLLRPLGIDEHWSTGGRTILSVAVSLAVVPFFLNPLWHLTHSPHVMLAAACAAVVALSFLRSATVPADGLPPLFEHKASRIGAWVVTIIVVGAVVLPYWPTELFGYPVPAQIHDFIKHHAILDSLERRALPLGNVFYAEGAESPVYYYHFFYLIPATVRLWTAHTLSIESAYGIASALVAIATTGMVYVVAKRFTGSEARATLAAALVTVIGALDIIPLIPHMLDIGQPVVVLDAWARHEYRIHSFLNQLIWAPQNVIGVLVVLVGAYMLSARGKWWGWLLLGPILGAAAVGSSIWIAIGALPALAVMVLTRPKWLSGAVVVAVLMVLVSLPMLLGYLESGERPGHGLSAAWPVNRYAVLGRLVGPGVLANALDLPFTLAIEFGARVLFLPLVAVSVWRKMWRDDGLRWLMLSACFGLVGIVVFHSHMRFNAFGQRIVMLPMVFTSILAACAVDAAPGRRRWWNPLGWQPDRAIGSRLPVAVGMTLVLVAGLPTGFWEAPVSAVRRYVEERTAEQRRTDTENAVFDAERAAYAFMRHDLPSDVVVQPDPEGDRAILAQLIRRQLGVIGHQEDVMVFDPRDGEAYARCVDAVKGELHRGTDPERAHAVLRRYRVTHLFIGRAELRRWSHLERFDDTRFFEVVFRRDGIRVVALE